MKKLIVLIAFLVTSTAFAQISVNGRIVKNDKAGFGIVWTGGLDSLGGTTNYDSLVTKSFNLEDFDGSDYFTLYRNFANAGTPKYKIILKGSEDNITFTDISTVVDTSTTKGAAWTAFNLSGVRASYYKLGIYAIATTAPASTFTLKIIAPKRDW